MASLITPQDLPIWVPGRIVSASDGLGWKDVAHRAYVYTGLDVPIPPMDHFLIVRYRSGETPMDRCVEGHWSRKRCAPGDLSLLTRSTLSHWHWTETINVSHIYLTDALMCRVASDLREHCVDEVCLHDVLRLHDPQIIHLADTLTAEAASGRTGGALYVEALAIQLAVLLLRQFADISLRSKASSSPLSRGKIRQLEEFIAANLHQAVSLETLARQTGLGVWTFTRHFRATTGLSPHEYVTRQRIERATRLLTRGRTPIKEVASACGFADQAHLTRVLRSRLGQTPGALRKGSPDT